MIFAWAIPLLWDYFGSWIFFIIDLFILIDEMSVFLAILLIPSVFFLCYETKLEAKFFSPSQGLCSHHMQKVQALSGRVPSMHPRLHQSSTLYSVKKRKSTQINVCDLQHALIPTVSLFLWDFFSAENMSSVPILRIYNFKGQTNPLEF